MQTRQQKQRTLEEELLRQIEAGELRPGDRLPSIKALCNQYRLGQRAVEAVIEALSERGVVEVRRRSGCYVSTARPATPAVPQDQQVLLDYLVPTGRRERLTFYLTEMDQDNLQIWQRIVADFTGGEVEVLSCLDGHPEDVLARHPVDVIQTSPAMLRELGERQFVPLAEAGLLEDEPLLPAIQKRFQEPALSNALPSSLVTQYLYVNTELAAAGGVNGNPVSITDLLMQARQAAPVLRRQGAAAFALPSLVDLLYLSGAVRLNRATGERVLNEELAATLFEALHRAPFEPVHAQNVQEEFEQGRLLFLPHCSFAAVRLARRPGLPWRALPAPVAKNVAPPCWHMVLAVRRRSAQPELALEWVRYLVSHPVQKRLAELHGNLPIYRDLARSAVPTDDGRLPWNTIEASLSPCIAPPSEAERQVLEQTLQMNRARFDLVRGRMTPAQALAELRCRCEFAGAMPQPLV